jgi:hypothetical protein
MPVAKIAWLYRTERDPFGAVEVGQLRVRAQIELFDMRFAIITGIQSKNRHLASPVIALVNIGMVSYVS